MERFRLPDGVHLALEREPGRLPLLVYVPGFNSTMSGLKARCVRELAEATGHGYLSFEHRGHGASEGELAQGSIRIWLRDMQALLARHGAPRMILVGASMGCWLALLHARSRPEEVAGIVGVGAAVDVMGEAMLERLSPEQRSELEKNGITWRPSRYGDGPYPLTRTMIADGQSHRVLGHGAPLDCPVRLLHGDRDPDVPWERALRILEGLPAGDITLTLIRDGDHRLSRDRDLFHLRHALLGLLEAHGRQRGAGAPPPGPP